VLEERRDQQYLRRPGDMAVRRSRKRKGIVRRALSLAAQLSAIGALYLIGRQIHLFCITSSLFEVKTIAIRGNQRAKTADLLALCSSALSSNIFRVDLAKLRSDLERNAWVKEASFRKQLPGTIEITVQERIPAAIVRFEGNVYLVDATGRRLAQYGPEVSEFDFPLLEGLEGLPRPVASERIRTGAAAIAALTQALPDFAKRVSALELSAPDRIVLRPSDGSPLLYLDTRDYLRNLENYAAIKAMVPKSLPRTDGEEDTQIAYVDLRFQGRIAVMPRTEEESTR
jgi:cell division septal protein FtsQ